MTQHLHSPEGDNFMCNIVLTILCFIFKLRFSLTKIKVMVRVSVRVSDRVRVSIFERLM